MDRQARISSLVEHCDLEERRALVPDTAKLRGLYFKNNIDALERAGKAEEFLELFPKRHFALGWHPLSEFLEHLAVAGAILAGPERIHAGMQAIGRNNSIAFSESLLGQIMIGVRSRDPVKLLKQAALGRRHSATYGRWDLVFKEPGEAVMIVHEEYLWVDSYIRGAGIGTFNSVGHDVEIEVEMTAPLEGQLVMRWDPRA